ncbi:MAG: hypothetical protein Q9P01_20135 [Anaerolineae bacterium]|nr:hypothetical protein [Anaerolineae bacterium]
MSSSHISAYLINTHEAITIELQSTAQPVMKFYVKRAKVVDDPDASGMGLERFTMRRYYISN